jgi:putative transposase
VAVFFALLDTYHSDDPSMTEQPSPPGYWGTRDDGYELHGLVRNDLYTLDWSKDRSALGFGVGAVLEDRYGFDHNERITLEVRGTPRWHGDDS